MPTLEAQREGRARFDRAAMSYRNAMRAGPVRRGDRERLGPCLPMHFKAGSGTPPKEMRPAISWPEGARRRDRRPPVSASEATESRPAKLPASPREPPEAEPQRERS